ncbi:MAG: AraC family transcriptional regulator [Clostridia bacterium]
MRKTVINRFRDFVDFNVIQYGHEDCRPNYSIGDFVRSNHLIHFIHKGKGIYRVGGKEFTLSAGDAFLIYPGDVTCYRADDKDPWEYSWVEFNGAAVSKYLSSTPFSKETPVIYNNSAAEKPMLRLAATDTLNPYELYCCLMGVLSSFVSGKPQPCSMADEYVKYALNYIHTIHYHGSVTVREISDYVGINRSYLCRLFKEKLGVSPKQYITEFKMKTAAKLLEESNLTVGQVARSAGFEDQLYFSTTFKSFFGHSPTQHRNMKNKSSEELK